MGITTDDIKRISQYSDKELIIMLVEAKAKNIELNAQLDRVITERNKLMDIVTRGNIQFPASKDGRPQLGGERPSNATRDPQQPKPIVTPTPPPAPAPPQPKPVVTPAPPRPVSKQEW